MKHNAQAAQLDQDAKAWLLRRARQAIGARLVQMPMVPPDDSVPWPAEQLRGCFVTLQARCGQLRGCVGTFAQDVPLWQSVAQMAAAAATEDRRFAPLMACDLADLVIEISALKPRMPVGVNDIVVGLHGLWIEAGSHQGVLLPQVALSYAWDAKTFVEQACVRAGLAADAWRDRTTLLWAFEAEIFAEVTRLT